MAIEFGNLHPHVTLSIFRSPDVSVIVEEVHQHFGKLCENLPIAPVRDANGSCIINQITGRVPDDTKAMGAWYTIELSPSWIGAEEQNSLTTPISELQYPTDRRNHLALLLTLDEYLVVYASQDAMRSSLNELVEFGVTGSEQNTVQIQHTAASLQRSEIETAFVRGSAKSAWLEGLHTSTPMKADRKILSGPNLRYAFDSFGDQTFKYSAAISDLGDLKPNAAKAQPFRVGVSHTKYTLWRGSTKTFAMFLEEIRVLIRLLKNPNTGPADLPRQDKPGLPVLASTLGTVGLKLLKAGFDVGYEPPSRSENEILAGGVAEDHDNIDSWQHFGRFEVHVQPSTIDQAITCDAFFLDKRIAKLWLCPDGNGDQSIEIRHRILEYYVPKDDPYLVHLDRSLAKRNKRFRLRYESGHIVQNGEIHVITFSDVIFEKWKWLSFDAGTKSYDITKEKPEKLNAKKEKVFDPTRIGETTSLFCYIKNRAANFISPSAEVPLSDDWMLLCDDGSGEIADFIAVDPNEENPFLTFIHVKAATGSDKFISVVPFSEVENQAQKNIRFLEPKLLAEELQTRTSDLNRNLVWRSNGSQALRSDFINLVEKLGHSIRRHLMLFQPQILRSTWDKAVLNLRNSKVDANVARMRQLSAVLSGAEESFRRMGATFCVVGVDSAPVSKLPDSKSVRTSASKSVASKKRRA